MFKTKWDPDVNGIILSNSISEAETIVPPRPVFLQELEILEINKMCSLPKTDMPICWCIDYRYYYKGKLFFERKGANIYKKPEIIFNVDFPYHALEPIDIKKVVLRNKKSLTTLENEAMDFIQDCYDKYNNKVDDFVVAFSGGKDSQVILDLVSRVIPADKYKAIFQDTDMELPCTYEIVKYTEEDYKYKFPGFKMYHAKGDRKAIDLWKQFGPPSRTNRWCCSVMKTASFRRKMKEIYGTSEQLKVVVYEGVRSDESTRRSGYDRIGENVKHQNLINCRAIFNWNTTEIFLYLFSRDVVLNPAYRYGLTRVGCGVCPFASDWSEYMIRRLYPDISKQYIAVIEKMGRNLGLNTQKKLNEYISSGNWQKNMGGRGIEPTGSRMDLISKAPSYECIITKPKTDWKIWLYALADNVVSKDADIYTGELNFKGGFYKFIVKESKDRLEFKVEGMTNQWALSGLLSKVLNKTTNCELCGVCEAECPTGALTVREKITMNKSMCVHCHKCLDVGSNGCLIAQRKQVYEGGTNKNSSHVKTSGIDKYSTFGLKDEWVSNYFSEGDNWFGTYPGLGKKMIPAAINWLREAELIDGREKKISINYDLIKDIYYSKPLIAWQIIWVALSFNSAVVNTFVKDVRINVSYEKDDIVEIMKESFPTISEATIKNPVDALINMLKNSPLGIQSNEYKAESNVYIAELEMKGKSLKTIRRIESDYVSLPALAYLLYKNAHKTERYDITVSELLEDSSLNPYTVFGMNADSLIKALKSLASMHILSADLLGGLENVHLNKDLTEYDVLSMIIKRL